MGATALKFETCSPRTAAVTRPTLKLVQPMNESIQTPPGNTKIPKPHLASVRRCGSKQWDTISGRSRGVMGLKRMYYYVKKDRGRWNSWWNVVHGKYNYFGWYGLTSLFRMWEPEKARLSEIEAAKVIISEQLIELRKHELIAIAEINGNRTSIHVRADESENPMLALILEHARNHEHHGAHHGHHYHGSEHGEHDSGHITGDHTGPGHWDSHIMPHLTAGMDHDPYHTYRDHGHHHGHHDSEHLTGDHAVHGHHYHGSEHGEHDSGHITGDHTGPGHWDSHIMPHLTAGMDHDPYHTYRDHGHHHDHHEFGHWNHTGHGHHDSGHEILDHTGPGHWDSHIMPHLTAGMDHDPYHTYRDHGHHHGHHDSEHLTGDHAVHGHHYHGSEHGEHDSGHVTGDHTGPGHWDSHIMPHLTAGMDHDTLHVYREDHTNSTGYIENGVHDSGHSTGHHTVHETHKSNSAGHLHSEHDETEGVKLREHIAADTREEAPRTPKLVVVNAQPPSE